VSKNKQGVKSVEELAVELSERLNINNRSVVAIAGAPGSGKTTICSLLQSELENRHRMSTQIVPMDGFHFDNAILQLRNLLSRKGSPATFDVQGLENILIRLTSSQPSDVVVPVFDRENDLSRGSAREVPADTRVILVEGNYLLLQQKPWSTLQQYFAMSIMIGTSEAALRDRLINRWLDLEYTESQAQQKVETNDLPNASEVISNSLEADILFDNNSV